MRKNKGWPSEKTLLHSLSEVEMGSHRRRRLPSSKPEALPHKHPQAKFVRVGQAALTLDS